MIITRRGVLGLAAAALVARRSFEVSAAEELKVPDNMPTETFDFETKGVDGWTMPEDEVFRRGVGHSRGAFVGGSPEEQKRLPMSAPASTSRPAGPLYAEVISAGEIAVGDRCRMSEAR